MNLPFTLKISFFFTSKIEQKKIKIGIHKSGTPRGGQRFMNFIHKIPFFLLMASLRPPTLFGPTCTRHDRAQGTGTPSFLKKSPFTLKPNYLSNVLVF